LIFGEALRPAPIVRIAAVAPGFFEMAAMTA
jgi:hypothetical protein